MASYGTLGIEGTLKYGTVVDTYTTGTIGQITDVNIPGLEADDVEITNFDSTDSTKEFIAGLKDPGELTFTVIYKPAEADSLYSIIGTQYFWELSINETGLTNSTLEFEGFIKKVGLRMPTGDKVTQEVTLRIGGAYDYTAGT